jgi:adenylate kinase family enzyme
MLSKPYTFLFIGRSGCGKGTQAELLKKYLEENDKRPVLYVYAGKRMRDLIEKENSLTSQKAKEIMLFGGKQPDFLAIWAWSNEFVANVKENVHLIIDGSPRTIIEAMVLDEAFEFYRREIIKPIFLDVSREWARDKLLKRARFDDTEEKINNRMDYFEKYVQPAVEYYETKSKNKLVRINGEPTIEEIHQEIIKKVFND